MYHKTKPNKSRCCIQHRNKTTLMYRNIIFIFCIYLKYTYVKNKRASEMDEMYAHRDNGAVFLWNLWPSLYNFPDTYTILVVTPPANVLHMDMLPVSHAIYATYAVLPFRKYLRPDYFRKLVYFLLCHSRNLRGISKGVFKSIFSNCPNEFFC